MIKSPYFPLNECIWDELLVCLRKLPAVQLKKRGCRLLKGEQGKEVWLKEFGR